MTLKILSFSDTPDFISDLGFLKYLKPILYAIRKSTTVKEIWLVEKNECFVDYNTNDMTINNLSSFTNGKEVIKKIHPDLLLINSGEYVSLSIILAANKMNIPTIFIGSGSPNHHSKSDLKYTLPKRILQFRKEGKSFIKKYVFFIKTLLALNYNLIQIFKFFSDHFFSLLLSMAPINVVKYVDCCIGSNMDWKNFFIKNNVDINKINIVGEYAMDSIHDRIFQLKKQSNDKLKVLFITTSVVEHGLWTKQNHYNLIVNSVKELKKINNLIQLTFKIHPTGENIDYYKSIVHPIDKSIQIFQNKDLTELVHSSDLIITYAQSNSLLVPLLLKKPIIVLNLFDESYNFINDGIVIGCNDLDNLIGIIQQKKWSETDQKKIDSYTKNHLFKFDGKCGERAAEVIMNFLN
jgi:UDP-N-acetylglucosamine 2-epimerase